MMVYFIRRLMPTVITQKNELEEGAYYVWEKEDLQLLIKDDYKLFADYYNVNNYGFWEHKNYVLIRKDDDASIIKKFSITQEQLDAKKSEWKKYIIKRKSQKAETKVR